jgi:hypothetical protein
MKSFKTCGLRITSNEGYPQKLACSYIGEMRWIKALTFLKPFKGFPQDLRIDLFLRMRNRVEKIGP